MTTRVGLDMARVLDALRALAAAGDPASVSGVLTDQARELGGPGALAAYLEHDQESGATRVTHVAPPVDPAEAVEVAPLGLVTRAIEQRRPVVGTAGPAASEPAGSVDVRRARPAVALPVIGRDQLFGVLVAASDRPDGVPGRLVESLEVVVEVAGGILAGLDRARLGGALLAARTAEHEVGNKLAVTVGWAELMECDPQLPPHLRHAATAALRGAQDAATFMHDLCGIERIRERAWGGTYDTTIDVRASSPPAD